MSCASASSGYASSSAHSGIRIFSVKSGVCAKTRTKKKNVMIMQIRFIILTSPVRAGRLMFRPLFKGILPYFYRVYSHPYDKIQERRQKSEKVGKVRNVRFYSVKLAEQFNSCVDEYKYRGRNRQYSPDVDVRFWKSRCKGKKNCIQRTACSNKDCGIYSGRYV